MIRCFNEFTRDSIVNDILSAISFELGYLATVSEQFSSPSPSPSFNFYLSFFFPLSLYSKIDRKNILLASDPKKNYSRKSS